MLLTMAVVAPAVALSPCGSGNEKSINEALAGDVKELKNYRMQKRAK